MSLAFSYAEALYEALHEKNSNDPCSIEKELNIFLKFLEEYPKVKKVLSNPTIQNQAKIKFIQILGEKLKLSEIIQNFLVLIVKKNRISMLEEVINLFYKIRLERNGSIIGQLSSPEKIPQILLKSLMDKFFKKLGKKVIFQIKIDPALLAGIQVTVGGITYSNTLRDQLNQFYEKLSLDFVEKIAKF